MFEQSILTNGKSGRRVWTTCAGVTGEAIVVVLAAVAPMVFPQALPDLKRMVIEYLPPVPPPPPGPQAKPEVTHVEPRRADAPRLFTVPDSMPPKAVQVVDELPAEAPLVTVPGSTGPGGGSGAKSSFDFTGLFADRLPPMPRPPETHPAPVKDTSVPIKRIRMSYVQPSQLLVCVKPVYPPLAKAARISGVVELEAVIATSGRLAEIRVKSGHPLLVPAAVEAVRQWVYKPTFLNGDAVEVATTIMVTFALNQ
jgi:protein TonB